VQITVELVADSATRPHFRQRVYHGEVTPTAQTPGTSLMQLTAGVGPFTYLLPGTERQHLHALANRADDMNGLFSIDDSTGVLRLKRVPTANEHSRAYTLSVEALNVTSGESDTTEAKLYIYSASGELTTRAFAQQAYAVRVEENQPVGIEVIDLNSTYEEQGRAVRYSFVATVPFGALNVHIEGALCVCS
jgi:hypothetical protein